MADMMNTREVAAYLRIKERKVYDLVKTGKIPCTRVTGKWLFPKTVIDLWVVQNLAQKGDPEIRASPPPIIAGSHDPLLDWAVRESGCGLALMFGGSLDGLRRFADGEAVACGLHVFDPASGDHNLPTLHRTLAGRPVVAMTWAWRDQGLIVAKGNPKQITGLEPLRADQPRFVDRQQEAGSRLLFGYLLSEQDLSISDLNIIAAPALSETEVGLAVAEDRADAGFGVAAVAQQLDLDFVPLARERYDLVIGRHDFFDKPWQDLLWFARSKRFSERAKQMGGYDVAETGRIVLNGA